MSTRRSPLTRIAASRALIAVASTVLGSGAIGCARSQPGGANSDSARTAGVAAGADLNGGVRPTDSSGSGPVSSSVPAPGAPTLSESLLRQGPPRPHAIPGPTPQVPPALPPEAPAGASSADEAADRAAIARLEARVKSLARATGCTKSAECRAAPVGHKACGGPRYFITYCRLSTDSAALFRTLEELDRVEAAYQRKYNIASTCEYAMPPQVEAAGGQCRLSKVQLPAPNE